jgi:WD40 repeat protein
VATWTGHETSIYSLYITESDLYSTSADKTARKWDLETGKCVSTFEHLDFVKCAMAVGPYLITGSRDEFIRIWDLSTDKCVKEIVGHFDEVSCLAFHDNKLWSGSIDCTIRSWNIKEQLEEKVVIEPLEEEVSLLTAEEELELAELLK